jgi:protocatechuate 3,4-dioxygenase beta subunit
MRLQGKVSLDILRALSFERNCMHSSHRHGLLQDLEKINALSVERRRVVRWLGGAGAAITLPLVGCGTGTSTSSTTASTTTSTTTTTVTTGSGAATCSTIPTETGGPYPGDGTNSVSGSVVNVLTQSGILRSDIASSFGSGNGTASGVAVTIKLTLVKTSASCAALANQAIYLWHCDALGRYSLYSSGVTGANFLRGVQVTNASGDVTFTTIFPGCYSGRWPHMHFEIYSSLAAATSGTNSVKTSQLAMPAAACSEVYAGSGYTGSSGNFASISLASDNVFSDGSSLQLPSIIGSASAGYVVSLQVAI